MRTTVYETENISEAHSLHLKQRARLHNESPAVGAASTMSRLSLNLMPQAGNPTRFARCTVPVTVWRMYWTVAGGVPGASESESAGSVSVSTDTLAN